jgi:asparagine synthase (glutamine-hydrolysing)
MFGRFERALSTPNAVHQALGSRMSLEAVVREALRHEPCMVSFSGGRDSSLVLAVAVAVARKHGLPDPIPVILRYPGAPETDETAWQESVLAHLGVSQREVVELHQELDALGDIAIRVLRTHGLLWPGNAYMHVPVFELARGGAVITGVGGDELFATRGARHVLLLRRRARPRRSDLRAVPGELLPRRIRSLVLSRRMDLEMPWLTPTGNAAVREALAREEAAWPARWDDSVRHWQSTRAFAAMTGVLELIAADYDVQVASPLLDPRALAAFAADGGATGFDSRTAAMRFLVGDLLPEQTLARASKAQFSSPLWGPEARHFAATWTGVGVNEALVDAGALRRQWDSLQPSFMTFLLMHAAWQATVG